MASHGYRWIDYQYMDEASEREHIRKAVAITTEVCGTRPVGMYQGKPNINTRKLVVEEGGFLYDSDCYSDDLPFWNTDYGRPHLVIPYTLDVNDMRFATPQGFNCGDQFYTYLKVRKGPHDREGRAGGRHGTERTAKEPQRRAAVNLTEFSPFLPIALSYSTGLVRLLAARGAERQPQDDVGGASLPPGGQAWPGRGLGTFPGLRQEL